MKERANKMSNGFRRLTQTVRVEARNKASIHVLGPKLSVIPSKKAIARAGETHAGYTGNELSAVPDIVGSRFGLMLPRLESLLLQPEVNCKIVAGRRKVSAPQRSIKLWMQFLAFNSHPAVPRPQPTPVDAQDTDGTG